MVEGDLGPVRDRLIPGHQIVGEVVGGATDGLPLGTRVGVSWLRGTDGDCRYCRSGHENLCDSPTFTGFTVDGGYAEYALARRDFVVPLPSALDDLQAAPLLCAGIIGFRSLRVAGVEAGERVGLFGFGASAHLALAVLRSWSCEVFVSTRGASHRRLAVSLGATWVGDDTHRPPVPLDYDRLLWGERQIRSVTNMTRADAREFLQVASAIGLRPSVTVFPLDQVNEALRAIKADAIDGAAVIVP